MSYAVNIDKKSAGKSGIIKKTSERVKELLEWKDKYRDDDQNLITRYWWEEARAMGYDTNKISASAMLMMMKQGKFTPADTITRARRKINEEFEHTRGTSYKPRKKQEESVKQELKQIA